MTERSKPKLWVTPNANGRMSLQTDRPGFAFFRLCVMTSRPCKVERARRRLYRSLSKRGKAAYLRETVRRMETAEGRELTAEEVAFLRAFLRGGKAFDAQRVDLFGQEPGFEDNPPDDGQAA